MQRKNGKLISPAQYAKMRGLNRSTISRQIRDGAIPVHNGRIDLKEADIAREKNLNSTRREQAARRKVERAQEEAVPPETSANNRLVKESTPSYSPNAHNGLKAEFDRGARWLAVEMCMSTRRVWPRFVGALDLSIFSEEQRAPVRGLFVALMTHLIEKWAADFVDASKLPSIDWGCLGTDAERIRLECEQLRADWMGEHAGASLSPKKHAGKIAQKKENQNVRIKRR